MKKIVGFMLAAFMMLPLAACGSSASSVASGSTSTAAGGAAAEGDTIVIGGLAPLTGGAAFYGTGVNNGIMMAVDEINAAGGILGKQIDYRYYDEKADVTEALNAYNKLMDEGMVALVGDVTTKPTIAVAQKAAQDGIPMITASATGLAVTEAGENIFRTCFTDPYQGELLANYAFDRLEAKTVAVLYDQGDDYSSGVADAFKAEAEKLGLEITSFEGYPNKNDDFSTQLTKIKASNPDVIMAPCYYEDASKIIVQGRELGIESTFIGPDGWDGVLGQVNDANKDALNNSFYCGQYSAQSDKPELVDFMANYREKYKMDENMFAVLGYDAMKMMATAIEEAGTTDAAAVVEAMKNIDYKGLSGNTVFDEMRNPVREAYIIEFADGEEVVKEAYNFK